MPRSDAEAVDYDSDVEKLSVGVAVILLATYVAGLIFSLRTHRDLFNPEHGEEDHVGEPWSVRRSVLMLAIAGVAVGVMSEILVGSISEASESIGLSPFFVGVIVVAIVGNAAEHTRSWGSPSTSSDGRTAARVPYRAAAVADPRYVDRSPRCGKQRRYLAIRDPAAQHSSSGDCSVAATWARLRGRPRCGCRALGRDPPGATERRAGARAARGRLPSGPGPRRYRGA
jgi:hypothetical protein